MTAIPEIPRDLLQRHSDALEGPEPIDHALAAIGRWYMDAWYRREQADPVTDIRPIQQPPAEDLRNALQIAEAWGLLPSGDVEMRLDTVSPEAHDAFRSVARLIRAALDKLAEPSAGAIRAARTLLDAAHVEHYPDDSVGGRARDREARDLCAAILKHQLEG